MTPEVQELSDRLAEINLIEPRNDIRVIERALTAHMDALRLPYRQIIWADDVGSACKMMMYAVMNSVSWPISEMFYYDQEMAFDVDTDDVLHAVDEVLKEIAGVGRIAPAATEYGDQIRRAIQPAVRAAVRDDAWHATMDDALRNVKVTTAAIEATAHAIEAPARAAAKRAAWRRAIWVAIKNVEEAAETEEVDDSGTVIPRYFWNQVRCETVLRHVRKNVRDAARDATQAIGVLSWLGARDRPEVAQLAPILKPLVYAFGAGLFLYWITSDAIICTLQPSLSVENGQLHRANGPAVAWPSGEAYYFLHGAQVSSKNLR